MCGWPTRSARRGWPARSRAAPAATRPGRVRWPPLSLRWRLTLLASGLLALALLLLSLLGGLALRNQRLSSMQYDLNLQYNVLAEAVRAGSVSPTVFWPVPNVDSGLVALRRRGLPETTASREQVFAVVDAAFGQRRKMLRSALSGFAGSSAAAVEALEAAGVDPQARGEVLDVHDFSRIAEGLAATRASTPDQVPE